MKRWRHRERLGDLIESARGEYVLFDEAERYGGSEYARGYANGSGDEGYYQREIARLRGTLSLAEEGLAKATQENERLRKQLSARLQELERIKRKRLDWAMLCDHDCPACTELDDAIRGHVPQDGCHAPSATKPEKG